MHESDICRFGQASSDIILALAYYAILDRRSSLVTQSIAHACGHGPYIYFRRVRVCIVDKPARVTYKVQSI